MKTWVGLVLAGALVWGCSAIPAYAQDEAPPAASTEASPVATGTAAVPSASTAEDAKAPAAPPAPTLEETVAGIKVGMDTVWVLVTAMLVFFMNLGFACVESGMCRAKNCVNILSKNFIVFAVASIAYWLFGFGLMFGNDGDMSASNYKPGFVGTEGVAMLNGADNSPAIGPAYKGAYTAISWTGVPLWAKFFFQLVFTGTAATIVSGAVAERIKYHSFILFSAIMAIVIYPVVGHWIWGGGWLAATYNFMDFAGSTQVHSIGGWAALVGVIVLGPRIGKYGPDGKVNAIPGHSMMAATIGCLILWLGWFGFNPGSTMAVAPDFIAHVCVTTNTAAAMATLTATATAWLVLGKPDLGMTLNGCLAGLVAITAPCAWVTVPVSALIGAIAGVLVVFGVLFFDKLKIDDPVGATSVHLLNGVFGTLCVGLFANVDLIVKHSGLDPTKFKGGLFFGGGTDQLMAQLLGIGATAAYVIPVSFVAWYLLKFTVGIRVAKEEELEGLDHGEHGNEAYHGFVMASTGE